MRSMSSLARCAVAALGAILLIAVVGQAQTGGGLYNPPSGVAPTDQITLDAGTITSSAPGVQVIQTWNNAAVGFTANRTNVTATAFASGSKLAEWQIGGTTKVSIAEQGTNWGIRLDGGGGSGSGVSFAGVGTIEIWNTGTHYVLRQGGANYMQLFTSGAVPAVSLGDGDLWLRRMSATQAAVSNAAGTTFLGLALGDLSYPPVTAPANPASGWSCYTDTADATLKCRDSAGTVRSIAAP